MDLEAEQLEMWLRPIDSIYCHMLYDERNRSWIVRARLRRAGEAWLDSERLDLDDVDMETMYEALTRWWGAQLFG